MANIPSPPGYDPKWSLTSAYMSPQRAEPSQDWLTPAGALRQDLDAHHNVAQFEAGAMKFAQGQTGTLFQTLFFMWMIGTQLSLFSMIFLVQGGFTPFLSILRVNLGALQRGRAGWRPCVTHPQSACTPPYAHPHVSAPLPPFARSLCALLAARREHHHGQGPVHCHSRRGLLLHCLEAQGAGHPAHHQRRLGAAHPRAAIHRLFVLGAVWQGWEDAPSAS